MLRRRRSTHLGCISLPQSQVTRGPPGRRAVAVGQCAPPETKSNHGRRLSACIVNTDPLFYQILRVRNLPLVEMQVPLGGRDIRVPQKPPGVFNPLLAADLRPAFMPGQIQWMSRSNLIG